MIRSATSSRPGRRLHRRRLRSAWPPKPSRRYHAPVRRNSTTAAAAPATASTAHAMAATGVKSRAPPKRSSALEERLDVLARACGCARARSAPARAPSPRLGPGCAPAPSGAVTVNVRSCARWSLRNRLGMISKSNSVRQDVRGRDLLQRGGAIHLIQRKRSCAESRRNRSITLSMKPAATVEPRASSGVRRLRVRSRRGRITIYDDARDLPGLESSSSSRRTEQLRLRSRPLQSPVLNIEAGGLEAPRVASATCCVERRSRCP